MRSRTMHWQSIRHYVNAGMAFPYCYASAELLDCSKSRLPTTGDRAAVTCKRCLKGMKGISK